MTQEPAQATDDDAYRSGQNRYRVSVSLDVDQERHSADADDSEPSQNPERLPDELILAGLLGGNIGHGLLALAFDLQKFWVLFFRRWRGVTGCLG